MGEKWLQEGIGLKISVAVGLAMLALAGYLVIKLNGFMTNSIDTIDESEVDFDLGANVEDEVGLISFTDCKA